MDGQDKRQDGVYAPDLIQRAIGQEQIRKAKLTLRKYKEGKQKLENRIIASERWWRLNEWQEFSDQGNKNDAQKPSAWLFNVVMGKHADAMAAYPEPNVLPREEADKAEAKALSSIIPCVLEENEFEQTYSDEAWQKMKQGTGIYGVFWDQSKLGGLGDIAIRNIDALNIFIEPGVKDIQSSRNVFTTQLVDNERLEQAYPQLKGKLKSGVKTASRYAYDDFVDTSNKSEVVDWYYKKRVGGKTVLHYCKFCADEVLYATENETQPPTMQRTVMDAFGNPAVQEVPVGQAASERGLYDDGEYPFVLDVLFPVEGSAFGMGYIDIGQSAQEQIDVMNQGIVKYTRMASNPRFFVRSDGAANEKEFADWTKPFVHVDGNLGEDTLRQIQITPLSGNYIGVLQNKIEELKWTTGNTDVSNGQAQSGVTAASAIAALQETAGRSSRDSTKAAYRAYAKLIRMVIERIRQFYDMPRKFRILGNSGAEEYVTYSNAGLQAQAQGMAFGMDMGYRVPVFDIKVSAQKQTEYTKMAQNELALQFYQMGFFNPQQADTALACLDMMDFDGKEMVLQKISKNGTMQQQLIMWQQMALQLAAKYEPQMAEGLAQSIMGNQQAEPSARGKAADLKEIDAQEGAPSEEHSVVRNAREKSQKASMPQ